MAALPATAITNFIRGTPRPLIPLKLRRNTCFASTNSSSSISAAASPQTPASITHHHHHQDHIVRPLENFSKDLWGDRFINLTFSDSELESCSRKVAELKIVVKEMLMNSTNDPTKNLLLINSLCRLGVSYHFETEIEEQLNHLFILLPQLVDNKDHDLEIDAVLFQLFRSRGYKMPCDMFNKFKKNGRLLEEELAGNTKGMISLYEASQWGTHGEDVLDEILAFTTSHLESLVLSQSCPLHLKQYLTNALKFPYHKCSQRVEARNYISYYEHDESRNDVLLEFAKYDFNRVQMLHQKELSEICRWWKKSNLSKSFSHERHRIVEIFFIVLEILFEPRYALSRNVSSKWLAVVVLLDDTYDAYGLYEELQSLTNAIERYDRVMDEVQGDYMKSVYEAILDMCDEVEEQVSKAGRSFSVSYCKSETKKLVRAYHAQARWTHEHILPTFDEYLENGMKASSGILNLTQLMMGMEEADEDAFQWLTNFDARNLRAMTAIGRLYNDIQSHEDEVKRKGQLSGLACYMKEYNVSQKEAIEGFKERIRNAWKDISEDLMVRPMPVPRPVYNMPYEFARVMEVMYKYDDGFTKPGVSFYNHIIKVLVDPIPLQE